MFTFSRMLALSIGASKLALAEFQFKEGQPPRLVNYGIAPLGVRPDGESDISAYVIAGIRDLMQENGIKPAPLMMTLSGQMVFPRYVRLPAVSKDKLRQMLQYEAEQNVPFPINEVVWDYQFVGEAEAGEQNAMIVAVKTEMVAMLTDCVESAGLDPVLVDVAPLALYNCVRCNYPDADGCTMVLDIGARSTNLVFIEEGRVFSRSIPVAGNAITNEVAKSFSIGVDEAEALKKKHAVVALGGVYAMSDNEVAEKVSKIVRNVVTRLYAEVNRSISFYRSQQSGSPPARVLLTGGTSIIPNMDTFFREKLKIDVDYLNPFENIPVGGRVDPDQAAVDFYQLAEVVGLALRRSGGCPMEINLIPPKLVQKRVFQSRLPYFGAAGLAVVASLALFAVQAKYNATLYRDQAGEVEQRAQKLGKEDKRIQAARAEFDKANDLAASYQMLAERRSAWVRMLDGIRKCMDDGAWLAEIQPIRDGDALKGILLKGYGFEDRQKAAEKAASETAGTVAGTAAELFCARLKERTLPGGSQRIFLDGKDDVKVNNQRMLESEGLREFTIEATFDPMTAALLSGKQTGK